MAEQVNQEPTAEQKTADIEAGMKMGYADEPPAAPVEKVDASTAEPATTEAAPAAAAKPDDKKAAPTTQPAAKPAPATDGDILKKVGDLVDGRLRNYKGDLTKMLDERFKSFTPSNVAAATAAVEAEGGDAPTKAQVQEAMQSTAKMKQLEADFPDFADALKEQAANLEQSILAKVPKAEKVDTTNFATKDDIASIRQATIDDAVDARDPEWVNKINTPQFAAWYGTLSPEDQALGQSDKLKDGFKFMDLYAEHEKALAEKAKNPQPNQQDRLRSAVAPKTGANKPPAKGGSVEDGMRFGYQNA